MLPKNLQEIVLEALLDHNDGWKKSFYRERLEKIKDLLILFLKKFEQ